MFFSSKFLNNTRYKSLVKLPGFLLFSRFLFVVLLLFSLMAKAGSLKPNLMLLKTYQPSQDVTGWLMSEKLDGVRAYWNGTNLISRQGNIYHAPAWFVKGFPAFALDGELWLGRRKFQQTVSIVKQQTPDDRWQNLSYNIFEVPNQKGGLLQRLNVLRAYLQNHPLPYIKIIEQKEIKSNQDVEVELKRILALGGEGLVVRKPLTKYQTGRLSTALKIKQKQDAECIVRSYTKGQGKFTGLVGALVCELIPKQMIRLFPKLNAQKKQLIKVGSGLSDYERLYPPKIGSVITFQYIGLTNKGLPRFPVFLRVRLDTFTAKP